LIRNFNASEDFQGRFFMQHRIAKFVCVYRPFFFAILFELAYNVGVRRINLSGKSDYTDALKKSEYMELLGE